MNILGISALYHDSAAVLVKDGEIIAASQEERFTRVKHDKRLPVNAINFCLRRGGVQSEDIDCVVYYDNPILTTQRFCENALVLGKASRDLISHSYYDIVKNRLWVKQNLQKFIKIKKFLVTKHHVAHGASAFFPSPFQEAVILTNDGVGEWETSTIAYGHDNKLNIKKKIHYPHSLGLLYGAFTYLCGFKVNEGDYKFMGLAPYGEPIFYDLIKEAVIDVKDDGSYRLNLDLFDFQNGRTMISPEMEKLFGKKRRTPESRITKHEMNIAASVQKVTEDIIIKQAGYAKSLFPETDNLVLAGGCALNCVANGKLLRKKYFNHIWIQPAAGDAGGALGAALYAYYNYFNNKREARCEDSQKGSFLGEDFSEIDTIKTLEGFQAVYHVCERDRADQISDLLAQDKIIGYFEGRAEFGPRALGHRSIIASPLSEQMQSKMNLKIKYRESFRPFAPSVLKEKAKDYFEIDGESPYMLICADVVKERRIPFSVVEQLEYSDEDMLSVVNVPRSDIPAVTHVDYSARIQTVDKERNPKYYEIIKSFEKKTGCPVIINTSFNVRGEPIVNSPKDAYVCFMRTEMDCLVIDDLILYKEEQPIFSEDKDWRVKYELD